MIPLQVLKSSLQSFQVLSRGFCSQIPLSLTPLQYTSHRSSSSMNPDDFASLSLSQKKISDEKILHFEKKQIYRISLSNCEITKKPFEKIIAKINKEVIREVFLVQTSVPQELISSLIESSCLSGVTSLNLVGLELKKMEIQLIKDLLPQSQIESLTLSCSLEDGKSIEEICSNLSIQFSRVALKQKSEKASAPQKTRKSFVFFSPSIRDTIQGGFDSYELIESEREFLKMKSLLKEGFLVTNIISSRGKKSIDGFIFTIAPGRGFICPFSGSFKDQPKKNFFDEVKRIFEDPLFPKIFSFYRYDFLLLNEAGVLPKGLVLDLQFAKRYLGPKLIIKTLRKIKKNYIPEELRNEYHCSFCSNKKLTLYREKSDALFQIYLRVITTLQRSGIYGMISKVLMPLEESLMIGRIQGIPVNSQILEDLKEENKSLKNQAKQNYQNYLDLTLKQPSRNIQIFQIIKEIFVKSLRQDSAQTPQLSPIEMLSPNSLKSADEALFFSNFFRILIKEQIIQNLINKTEGNYLKSIYRTPDMFRGIQLIPDPTALPEALYPKLFQIHPSEEVLSIQAENLSIRALAHLSGDPKLIKICNNKSKSNLENKMNKALFESKEFLEKTSYLNRFACGKIKKETLAKFFPDNEELIDKYFSVFPRVQAFHEEMEWDSYKIYKKVRILENTLFSMIYIFFSKNLMERKINSSILFASGHQILMRAKKGEESILQQILFQVSNELSIWSVATPLTLHQLSENEKDGDFLSFLNQPTQGVIPNLKAIPQQPIDAPQDSPILNLQIKEDLEKTLKQYFNSMNLKPLQEEVIQNILNKKSTVALLPTGYGKSVCFQVPAMLQEGITIIICPLLSLIQNQVMDLKKRGIEALWVKSPDELKNIKLNPSIKMIYVTPELLLIPRFIHLLKEVKVSLCVIDEAHCVYEWGNTFRESYRNLGKLKEIFPQLTTIALSATMTKRTLEDLLESVNLDDPKIIKGSLYRKNLAIKIYPKLNLEQQLLAFLEKRMDRSGVIYCQTKDDVEKVHQLLLKNKIFSLRYHAGLTKAERNENLFSFLEDKQKIMVATVAFGMGIDKPNIRYVFHISMPGSLEQYFQEIGRAGRDGNPSECVMLHSDIDFMNSLIMKKEIVNPKIQEELNLKTNQLLSFVQDTRCRQQLINEYFTGEESTEVCGSCDVCQNTLKTVDIRESAVHAFKAVALTNGERGISSLAKLLCGIELHRFSVEEQNTSVFGSMKKYPVTEVKSFLRYLVQRGYINYLPSSFDGNNGSLSLTLNAIDLSNSKKPLYAPLLTQDKDQRSPLGPD